MENKNPDLEKIVEPENDLKNMLVEYVGNELLNNQGDVTVEMIVEVMAKEFPEFVLALAEENWIRGYQQALEDVDTGLLLNKQEQEGVENVEFKDLFKEQSR